jgi:hypothetical protein
MEIFEQRKGFSMKKWLSAALLVLLASAAFNLNAQSDPESEVFGLINQYRGNSTICIDRGRPVEWAFGSPQLGRSATLDVAAENHTQTMKDQKCFDHQCPDEADPLTRIAQANHQGWDWAAENILRDTFSASEALFEWQSSDLHNEILLACQARSIGIAKIDGWWTAVFTDATPPVGAEPPSPNRPCYELDANENNFIDDDEIQAALQMWASATPICP